MSYHHPTYNPLCTASLFLNRLWAPLLVIGMGFMNPTGLRVRGLRVRERDELVHPLKTRTRCTGTATQKGISAPRLRTIQLILMILIHKR